MTNKTLPYLLIMFLLISFSSKSQTIEVIGSINVNTNWSADTVKIIGDVTVEQNILLTISPGVYVESQGYYSITIAGEINAIGLPSDTITFTVNDPTGFWSDTTSVNGGWHGIYIIGEEGSTDSSIFKYCKLEYGKNYDAYGCDVNGGALYVNRHGFLHINHCLFTKNMVNSETRSSGGPYGGAIYCENVDEVLIDSSSFIKNRSFYFSGAIRIDYNCYKAVITNNTFINNMSMSWHYLDSTSKYSICGGGGAISTSDLVYSPEISNNRCFNNTTLNGVIYTSNLHSRIFNNIICNNWGCGIEDGHQLSTSRMFNNTIVNNKTHDGAILLFSNARVYNNICWGNLYHKWIESDQIILESANPILKNNCVQYGNGGEGALYDYPEFVNPTVNFGPEGNAALADWSLGIPSPCINAGTPDTTSLTLPEYDIIGKMRIYGNRVDIGAFENQDVWSSTNEIALLEERISVSPNPATTTTTITLPPQNNQEIQNISIFDALGRTVFQTTRAAHEQTLQINVSDWESGLYVIVVSAPQGFARKTKLVIK